MREGITGVEKEAHYSSYLDSSRLETGVHNVL